MRKPRRPQVELQKRLIEFNNLVKEYEEIAAIVPYESKLTLGDEASEREIIDHKSRLLRLTLLRKFVSGSDWCHLPSLLQDVADYFAQSRPDIADEAQVGIAEFDKRSSATLLRLERPDLPPKGAPETVWQLMYGSLLHADFDKRRGVDPMSMEAKIMLLTWLPDMEAMVRTARHTFERWLEQDNLWAEKP